MHTPPLAERRPRPVTFHGETFEDPWAWLRDRDDPAVRAYLEAENAWTERALAGTKELQEALYREMLGRIKQTDLTVPFPYRGAFYYTRTEEGKQYPIHCRKRGSLEAGEEVLVDVNALAEGKAYMDVGEFEVTDDGNLLAYSTDETGFREYTLQVKDLRTEALLPLRVERAGTAVWAPDGRVLFYTVEDDAKRPYRLVRHDLGSDRHEVVYEETDEAFRIAVSRTRSGQWFVLSIASHTTSEEWILPAGDPAGTWRVFLPRRRDIEYELDHQGDRWILRINDTGRNFRVVAVAGADGAGTWTELMPHRPDVMIEGVEAFAGHLVVSERRDGLPALVILPGEGSAFEIAFPERVCEAGLGPNWVYDTRVVRYHYQSLVTPDSVFEFDLATRASTLLKRTEVLGGYDPAQYASERLHAAAPDGVAVPVSLVWRRDRPRDGSAPLLLTGYGAYGYPFPITFSSNRLSLLDRGFAVAIAHVRGGGELGKPWHDGGRMAHKMNTFLDFIAVADRLVEERWTSRDGLVIEGGSAGGLLVGAVVNLRPDLCRAVLTHVPFVDVLHTMSDPTLPLTVAEYEEWGNPAIPEQYRWMRAYCPYTNLAPARYPAMLVRTAFHDSQVMYWEPAKYVARLRTLDQGDGPLLLLTNMGAGHGGASGRYDHLREVAVDYAFILESER